MSFFSLAEKIRPLATDDDTTTQFWLNLHNFKSGDEYPYRELTQGVIKMFCLPHSNAEAERDFSAVKYYKSDRRSLMSTKVLEAILLCKGRVLFNPGWVIRYENCLNVKKTAQKHALVCKIKF